MSQLSLPDDSLLNFPIAYSTWKESGQEVGKAQEIYETYRINGRAQEVFRKAFSREIRQSETTFLRHSSSSLSLQLLNILFKSPISKKFIKRIVGGFLSRLLSLGAATRTTNADVVELCVQFLRDKFFSRITHCPVEIKLAFRELRRLLLKYKRSESLLESAFFLHYICPAVILPAEWDLVTEVPSGDQLQYLILACRFLQCAANGTSFPDPDARIGFGLVEARTVMQKSLTKMLENDESPPSMEESGGSASRRALLGEIVSVAGRAKSTSSSKARRNSDIPRKERSQTMSSPQLAAIDAAPEDAIEAQQTHAAGSHSAPRLRKSESGSRRRLPRPGQTEAPIPSPTNAADNETAASEDEDSDHSSGSSNYRGSSKPAKRTPLIQAIRNTAASKKYRHSVALTSLGDLSSAPQQPERAPKPSGGRIVRSQLLFPKTDIPSELKARTVINLEQEKELFGDLLWRNSRTIVLLLRSLTSSEGYVRQYVNQLTGGCSDSLFSNRIGVILVAQGRLSAAQQLRKTLPFGYMIVIDKRRRIYDTLGCLRISAQDDGSGDSEKESTSPRASSVESAQSDTNSITSANAFIQLGGVFGFAKHQLVAEYLEGRIDDLADIDQVLKATISSPIPSATQETIEINGSSSDHGPTIGSSLEIPITRARTVSQERPRKKSSSSRNLSVRSSGGSEKNS